MPPLLKGRSLGLIFGAAFAIGLLLLVLAALATSLSSGISEEQRASQAAYVAFGYKEDCDAVGSTQSMFWCGSLFGITTCHLRFRRNSQTRYYACYDPRREALKATLRAPAGGHVWSTTGEILGCGVLRCIAPRRSRTPAGGATSVLGTHARGAPTYAKHT